MAYKKIGFSVSNEKTIEQVYEEHKFDDNYVIAHTTMDAGFFLIFPTSDMTLKMGDVYDRLIKKAERLCGCEVMGHHAAIYAKKTVLNFLEYTKRDGVFPHTAKMKEQFNIIILDDFAHEYGLTPKGNLFEPIESFIAPQQKQNIPATSTESTNIEKDKRNNIRKRYITRLQRKINQLKVEKFFVCCCGFFHPQRKQTKIAGIKAILNKLKDDPNQSMSKAIFDVLNNNKNIILGKKLQRTKNLLKEIVEAEYKLDSKWIDAELDGKFNELATKLGISNERQSLIPTL